MKKGKVCPRCEEYKTADQYHTSRNRRDGLYYECKKCRYKRVSANSKKNYDPQKARSIQLKRNYGITEEDYLHMFMRQEGVCACCGREETHFSKRGNTIMKLSVDHCHKTGKVRALLCNECNTSLGLLDEDPERVACLLRYVINLKEEVGNTYENPGLLLEERISE